MRKLLALILSTLLLMSCTCMAAAENIEFVLPANSNEVAYPELETMPAVKTKTIGDNITVTVSEAVDELRANWRGYQEEPVVLELDENNQATFSKADHKYQLGTHWVNWSYTWDEFIEGYGYDTPDSEIEVPEGGYIYTEEPSIEVVRVTPTGEYEKWVDEETGEEYSYEIMEVETIATYSADTDKSTINVPEGCEIWENSGGKYVLAPHTEGAHGYGNSAYTLKKGAFTAVYKRNGDLLNVTKDETADYFQVGREGDGHVAWNQYKKQWYISYAEVSYPEGELASIGVSYHTNGSVDHYYVTYRFEDNQYYEVEFNRHNQRTGGYYWQEDDEGNTIRSAYAISLKKWKDNKTGKLTDSQALNWGLLSPTDEQFLHSGRQLTR